MSQVLLSASLAGFQIEFIFHVFCLLDIPVYVLDRSVFFVYFLLANIRILINQHSELDVATTTIPRKEFQSITPFEVISVNICTFLHQPEHHASTEIWTAVVLALVAVSFGAHELENCSPLFIKLLVIIKTIITIPDCLYQFLVVSLGYHTKDWHVFLLFSFFI